jgi:hypothetical protein
LPFIALVLFGTLASRVGRDTHVQHPQLPNCGRIKQRGRGWAWGGCFNPHPQGCWLLAMMWHRRLVSVY